MTKLKIMPHAVGNFLKGVGVESVELDTNNHLIVHLDNGEIVDAGEFKVDDELDAESTRPLANKTLSSLFSAVDERINTLVGGNATEAIDNLNEIIAFLQNFKDSETLASTLAEINNAIAEVENDLQIKWRDKGYEYEAMRFTEAGEYDVPSGVNNTPYPYIATEGKVYKLEGKISLSGGTYVEKVNNKLVISGGFFAPIYYITKAKPILDILIPSNILRKDDVLGDIIEGSTLPVQSDAIAKELQKKVDKVDGKGLSTNDYSNEEKDKVSNINRIVHRTLACGEFGLLNNRGLPDYVRNYTFPQFFGSVRNGRFIETNTINLTADGLIGRLVVFDKNYAKVREELIDSEISTKLEGEEKYVNFQLLNPVRTYTLSRSASIDNTTGGITDTTTGCAVTEYIPIEYFDKTYVATPFSDEILVYAYLYDEDKNFLGRKNTKNQSGSPLTYINQPTHVTAGAKFFRFRLFHFTNALTDEEFAKTKAFTIGNFEYMPNVEVSLPASAREVCMPRINDDTIVLAYETSVHKGTHQEEWDGSVNIPSRYFNQLLLRLPKNYSPDGKPLKCILFTDGTGSLGSFQNMDFTESKMRFFDYWCAEGYAVLSCNTPTSKYANDRYTHIVNFATPTQVAALKDAFYYVASRYNISDKGCFVSGKSQGGLMCAQLMYSKLPILACAPMAPKLSGFPDSINNSNRILDAEIFAEEFEFDEGWRQFYDGSNTSATEKNEYMRSQWRKVMGYIPLTNGVITSSEDDLWDIAKLNAEKLSKSARYCSTPVTIFMSSADTTTSYDRSKAFIQSLQNGGSIARLRTLPAPTDGVSDPHGMVDTAPQAPIVERIIAASGEVCENIPITFVEAVQFFREFEN